MRQKHYFDESPGDTLPAAGRNPHDRRRRGAATVAIVFASVGVAWILAIWVVSVGRDEPVGASLPEAPPAGRLHPIHIVVDDAVPRVLTGTVDPSGAAISVRCGACHSTKTPDPTTRRTVELDLFHQGLEFRHGELSCLACHDASDYDRLKSADGAPVEFAERQTLCAQCHGPTARDYEHGAHGGMVGHWDRTRGPRTRLGCTQCHDPHAPAYPTMSRTFFSIDRFAEGSDERH